MNNQEELNEYLDEMGCPVMSEQEFIELAKENDEVSND